MAGLGNVANSTFTHWLPSPPDFANCSACPRRRFEEVADVRAPAIGRCLRRWQMFEVFEEMFEVADV